MGLNETTEFQPLGKYLLGGQMGRYIMMDACLLSQISTPADTLVEDT